MWWLLAAGGLVIYALLADAKEFGPILAGPNLVTSGWGDDRSYRGGTHEGLDLHGVIGTPVLAAHAGKVIHAGTGTNTGLYIALERADGVVTRYLHLSYMGVKVGQFVRRGAVIGKLGQTGIANSGPHTHFDTLWPVALLHVYQTRYGLPVGGVGTRRGDLVGVPSEPLLPASFAARVIERARRQGIMV